MTTFVRVVHLCLMVVPHWNGVMNFFANCHMQFVKEVYYDSSVDHNDMFVIQIFCLLPLHSVKKLLNL